MSAVVVTPLLHGSQAIELAAGTWAKKLLPVGTVEYRGRMLRFDRPYLEGIVQAFGSGAYDQVPFQLADAGNSHTNDPERTRGWVTGMQLRDDGLYVMVETTEAGNQVLSANPRLGVSARIVEDYARSDGKYYPAAVQHVLGTLDPRIPELGPWQRTDLSNSYGFEPDMVIDLSSSDWDGEPLYEFAGDAETHPLSPALRGLASDLDTRHPGLGAGDHVRDAADALDMGLHEGAKRHLRAAMANMTPQSLMRHGQILDDDHNAAKRSMDDIHRHLLLVQQDQDEGDGAQATDHHPDVKARTDVTQPIPSGYQRMGTYSQPNDGGGLEFADPMSGAYAALELAHQQAALREAEDAARPGVRDSRGGVNRNVDQDRLAYALDRIGRGSYQPSQAERNLGLADEGGYGYGYGCSCGATGDDGRTVSTTHLAGCESALSSDEQAQYRHAYADIAAQPFADSHGRTWMSQFGEPMTAADHLEALTGQRLAHRGDPFATGLERRELAAAQRVNRFGDYEGGDPGDELSGASQAAVAALRGALGLPDYEADRQAKREVAYDRLVHRPPQRFRTLGEAMDYGAETTRERAERMKEPVAADFSNGGGDGYARIGWDDGCRLPGELTGLTRHSRESLAY